MENDKRLIELFAEMLQKQDQMVEELRNVKSEMIKLNLQTSENTRAVLKLADKIDTIGNLENRVSKLEKAVFK